MTKIKKEFIFIVTFIFACWFGNADSVHARIPSFTTVYSNNWTASFLNEEMALNVQVGNNVIANPCNKNVKLSSNRPEYDIITEVNSKVECNCGHTYFKIKSSKAGISKVVAEIDGKIIGSCDISFFTKRKDDILIRPNGHPIVYLIKDGYKYKIKNPSMLYAHGYKWSDVIDIDPVEEHLYELGKKMKMESLINVDGQIYYIYNDLKLSISQNMVDSISFNSLSIHNISDKNLVWQLRRMKLLLNKKNKKVYYLTESGKKRHIINEAVFNSYNNGWEDVVEVSDDFLKSFLDTSLVKAVGDYKVYKLENGRKRWIRTAEIFNNMGFNWGKITSVNSLEINEYPEGEVID